MTTVTTDYAETLAWTQEITGEAARLATTMLARGITVSRKADDSAVTDIDQAVERFLREKITARFPHHAILGEEYGYDARAGDAPLWAIDPIDGTTNLANGIPHWGVSVGLVEQGEPVVGVLAFPRLNETYAGAKGQGAFCNGVALPALPPGGATHWEDTYAVCSTSVRRMAFDRVPARLRVIGSAALELCWTAAGHLRASQTIGVSLWDIAAGACLVREVGGAMEWLSDGTAWSAGEMAQNGKRENDVLLTGPRATLDFLRTSLSLTP